MVTAQINKIFIKLYRLAATFFTTFLILHFLSIAPVANFLCLCPEKDPNWKCTCNCSKCDKRRQINTLSFDFYHTQNPQKESIFCSKGNYCRVNHPSGVRGIIPAIPVESGSCKCRKHTEDLSKDIKQFIPISFIENSPDNREKIICTPETILISKYIPKPDEHPG